MIAPQIPSLISEEMFERFPNSKNVNNTCRYSCNLFNKINSIGYAKN